MNNSHPVIPYNMMNTFYQRKPHFDIMNTYKNSRLSDIQYPQAGSKTTNIMTGFSISLTNSSE